MAMFWTFYLAAGVLYGVSGDEEEYSQKNMPLAQYYDGKKIVLPVSDDSALDMYKHWVHQGLSGLISSIGSAKCQKLNEYYKRRFFTCSQKSGTIYDHSRCIDEVIEAEERLRLAPLRNHKLKVLSKLKSANEKKMFSRKWIPHEDSIVVSGRKIKKRIYSRKSTKPAKAQPHHDTMWNHWVGSFKQRVKRMVTSKVDYTLRTPDDHLTLFGTVAKALMQMVRGIKNKTASQTFEAVMGGLQTTMEKVRLEKEVKRMMKERIRTAYKSSHKLDRAVASSSGKKKDELEEFSGSDELHHSAASGKGDDVGQQIMRAQMKFVRQVVELAKTIAGDNSSSDVSVLKIVSPRLLSLTREEDKGPLSNMLSPSIFSLHDKGQGLEALLSVPSAMKAIDNPDYRQWMDLIIEASGVPDVIERIQKDDVLEVVGNLDDAPRGIDGQPMHFTKQNATEILGEHGKRQIEVFEQLQSNFTDKQQKDFKETGYSILTREQMDHVYGKQSPYNDSTALRLFKSLSEAQIRRRMEINLRELAKAEGQTVRAKRQAGQGIILSPIVLTAFILNPVGVSQPLILSPVAIAPLVLSPAIFGPVILSPWVMVPVILSPRLLSPTILSPVTLATAILSPLAFNPFILSPGALLPLVLSPLLLDPFILSPQVMTPLVLCPFALSPFIFNPTLFSPLILSPFVLSPSFFSPVYMTALVLSPHALSPLINSTGKYVTLILSPSILS